MKLTTAETQQYARLVAKMAAPEPVVKKTATGSAKSQAAAKLAKATAAKAANAAKKRKPPEKK